MVWLKEIMNNILVSTKFPKLWRKSKVIAILKPGKDSSLPKRYRPISLLCHTYKLLERMIPNPIKSKPDFRAGKACTIQLLNLTPYIKQGPGTYGSRAHLARLMIASGSQIKLEFDILKAITKWGVKPEKNIKTTALAFYYSTMEYACPVWERSTYVSKLDLGLNEACRSITGCVRPTSVANVYFLVGIAPSGVRSATTSRQERIKQTEDPWHSLYS